MNLSPNLRHHLWTFSHICWTILVSLMFVSLWASEPLRAEEKQGSRLGSTATAAAPLHAEQVKVGTALVTVGFYMWPIRSDQSALLYIEGPLNPSETQVMAVPTGKTNASRVKAWSMPDQVQKQQSWHELQVGVRGDWILHIQAGDQEGNLPLSVAGPPEIPLWLGWLIGLSPLTVLAWFVRTLRLTVTTDPLLKQPWWERQVPTVRLQNPAPGGGTYGHQAPHRETGASHPGLGY